MLGFFLCQVFCYQDLIFRDSGAVWIFRDRSTVWVNVLVVKIRILEMMVICVVASLLDIV